MKDFTQDFIICENAQEHNAKIVRAVTHEQFSHMEAPPTLGHPYWVEDTTGRSFYSEDLYTACDLFLKYNEWPQGKPWHNPEDDEPPETGRPLQP